MAESMTGLKRTHRCAELSEANIGEKVTIMGWVQKNRNKGGLVFVDVRDRSGLIQVVFEEGSTDKALLEKAAKLRSEFVVAIVGTVEKRSGAVNENLATGAIEIKPEELRILSESETPPFPIEENSKTKEEVRLKYRFLDLRRPDIQRNLMMRSRVATLARQFMAKEGFLEIETPFLIKSTPEGARDYLVPSRIHPGSFYALPQSPQIFKQLLMCSGYDRYFQIVKCFRDEDLRADRQPEFTQMDMELSFVDVDDVIDINERLLAHLFKDVLDIDVQLPIQRMTWQEAMDRFGSDKPDIRFGMEINDLSDRARGRGFAVFDSAEYVGGIVATGCAGSTRKQIDELTEFVKRPQVGAKGLVWIRLAEDGSVKSSIGKFFPAENHAAAGAAQGLVGSGGDHVGVRHRRLMQPGRYQTGDVGHVHHEIRAHGIGHLPEFSEVDDPGIGGGTGNDDLGLAGLGGLQQRVIVDGLILAQTVGHDMEILAGDIDGAAVAQVAAVGQIHAQNGVPRLRQCEEGRQIGVSTGVGLNIGILAAE